MADPVGFGGVEKQNLIGFGDGLVAAQMAGKDAAIGKDQFGGVGAFLRALMLAMPSAADNANRDAGRIQQGADGEVGRVIRHQVSSIASTRSG
jgi:hypothetical protein